MYSLLYALGLATGWYVGSAVTRYRERMSVMGRLSRETHVAKYLYMDMLYAHWYPGKSLLGRTECETPTCERKTPGFGL